MSMWAGGRQVRSAVLGRPEGVPNAGLYGVCRSVVQRVEVCGVSLSYGPRDNQVACSLHERGRADGLLAVRVGRTCVP